MKKKILKIFIVVDLEMNSEITVAIDTFLETEGPILDQLSRMLCQMRKFDREVLKLLFKRQRIEFISLKETSYIN